MAGSQLKRLKASLREQGIIGSQKSKKQKRRSAQDPTLRNDKRLQKSEALHNIREQFNPFQFKMSARGPKFQVTTNQPAGDKLRKGIQGRPGLSRARGEEKRRETILVEMNRGNKVGGIHDNRFGEANPHMSLEDKLIQRFVAEKQRNYKRRFMFNLEDDEGLNEPLTHGGKSISFDEDDSPPKDDFDERDIPPDDDDDASDDSSRTKRKKFLKRLRQEEGKEEDNGEEEGPERKKTKKEVMTEVIAKSKLYKYERQAAKEEDRDLIDEINQELPGLRNLLFQPQGLDKPQSLATEDKPAMDKEYDVRVKQLAADKRAQPAERTKTEEEIAEEERNRLKELEEKRLKRMSGEQTSDDEHDDEDEKGKKEKPDVAAPSFAILTAEDEDEFGLGKGVRLRPMATELGLDDEDDFLIDDDLVASGSEIDDDTEESEDDSSERQEESESEDEFVKGLVTEAERPIFESATQAKGDDENGVPYTFPCPQAHEEMLAICKGIDVTKLPLVVQRIRALYHPKLDKANREKLGKFSQVLVQHIAFLARKLEPGGIATLESLTRHVHSLAKNFPIEVGLAYRLQLEEMKSRPFALGVGDLISLTGISVVFPTSDHFHQVTTPAMLSIARFLGQSVPQSLADFATGTYLAILSLQYQQLAKRYVPELMNFCLNTLQALAPTQPAGRLGNFPVHEPAGPGIRIRDAKDVHVRKLNCADCCRLPPSQPSSTEASDSLKVAIASTVTALVKRAAETWHAHAAFFETFQPAGRVLQHLLAPATQPQRHLPATLVAQLADADAVVARLVGLAHVSRRPLELHHHRPLPIRTIVPRFEDDFNPDRHYDPDRSRAELAKLQADHRREKRGAMRELRRDADFVARESLRRRKDRDAAYEKKYKHLVAEIQGEEGHAANEYAREKAARKKGR